MAKDNNLFHGKEGKLFLDELIEKIKAQEPDKWIYTSRINEEETEYKPFTSGKFPDPKIRSFKTNEPTLGFAESTIFERPTYYFSAYQEIYKTRIDILDVILENVKEYYKLGDKLEKETYGLIVLSGEKIGTIHGNKAKEVFKLVKQKVSEYQKKKI